MLKDKILENANAILNDANELLFIDMPGFEDYRGMIYEINNEIITQLIAHSQNGVIVGGMSGGHDEHFNGKI